MSNWLFTAIVAIVIVAFVLLIVLVDHGGGDVNDISSVVPARELA